MIMARIAKWFNRMAGIDRNDELQHPDAQVADDSDWQAFIGPIPSMPNVIHFSDRLDLIEMGYWSGRRPRRAKRINLEREIASRPGATAKINRLIRRGYYQSLRHAS